MEKPSTHLPPQYKVSQVDDLLDRFLFWGCTVWNAINLEGLFALLVVTSGTKAARLGINEYPVSSLGRPLETDTYAW